MRIYSYLILLLLPFLTGCLGKSARQEENVEYVAQNDTAYVIEPFLKEDVTYINKNLIMRDCNDFPTQEYELSQMTIKIHCETAMGYYRCLSCPYDIEQAEQRGFQKE